MGLRTIDWIGLCWTIAIVGMSVILTYTLVSYVQINIIENGADRRQPPRVVDPEGKHKARQIDKISRKMFPLAFALFNLVYWTMYTLPFTEDDDNDV